MSTQVATPGAEPIPEKRSRKSKPTVSDRSRAENRLGLQLVAPAVILMLLVTAYPMLQLYLSLFPLPPHHTDDREFIGLSNYVTVLTDPLFWQDTWSPC